MAWERIQHQPLYYYHYYTKKGTFVLNQHWMIDQNSTTLGPSLSPQISQTTSRATFLLCWKLIMDPWPCLLQHLGQQQARSYDWIHKNRQLMDQTFPLVDSDCHGMALGTYLSTLQISKFASRHSVVEGNHYALMEKMGLCILSNLPDAGQINSPCSLLCPPQPDHSVATGSGLPGLVCTCWQRSCIHNTLTWHQDSASAAQPSLLLCSPGTRCHQLLWLSSQMSRLWYRQYTSNAQAVNTQLSHRQSMPPISAIHPCLLDCVQSTGLQACQQYLIQAMEASVQAQFQLGKCYLLPLDPF